jgi:bacterioferritin
MRGNEKVIALLNAALKEELTAVSQYFLHAEMCGNWGYGRISQRTKKRAIDEMKHAEALIERLLFLEGTPQMAELLPLKVGGSVKPQLENDLAAELAAIAMYNASANACAAAGDNGSKELFEKLLADEEGHADWLETQLGLIEQLGLENYLSQQLEAA